MHLVPMPIVPFEFNTEIVLQRLLGNDATNTNWMENGITIVNGAYDYPFMDLKLIELVKHEFNMYHHHHYKMNN